MAELVLSALLPVLFEKLGDAALKSIARYKGIDAEIKKWQRSLMQIKGVLTDASRKEITNEFVKQWLEDLQHLAYDIDDVLDGLAIEAVHRQFTHESQPITSKVKKLIPSCCTNFSRGTRVLDKLDTISAKLEDLVKQKTDLGLIKVEEELRLKKQQKRSEQTSVADPSSMVGRKSEIDELVKVLLGGETCDRNISIVPIVGMGGVGKTTLARLLYNNKQVNDHFQLKAWSCVSDDFDSLAIGNVIFKAATNEDKQFTDLNLLQVSLENHLRGKRFLLVLDDVWSEKRDDWDSLVGPFHVCAPGSKIIFTTRKEQLLRQLGYGNLRQLEDLSSEDALSLLALYALGVNNFDSHLSLKPHGASIVEKCKCLPLALKAIGCSLSTKRDERSWKELLDSGIWDLPVKNGIIPALKLSYHELSSCLKQLFAYCSLFPKDYVFDKEDLVLIWMGEGFLQQSPPSHETEEKIGRKYFDELLSRSFFQHAPNNESFYVMHDMMNDLAKDVAGNFFVRLDTEAKKDIMKGKLEKYRHMSFVRETFLPYKKFDTFTGAKSLRTFIATSVGEVDQYQRFYLTNKVMVNLLPELPLLRVLSLSKFEISELPESLGTLRHLRYLNLSRTNITHLPENVCNLYHLQTLIVAGCHSLARLPNSFSKLKNLRNLDISDTPCLGQMPLGIGELKSLQTLSKIIIGGESRFEISNLKDFENLCGKISIVGLENVKNEIDARDAKFSRKMLSELEVTWCNVLDESRNKTLEKDVLNELKPCSDTLMQLKIESYGGLDFPNWVGDPFFTRLNRMSIAGCKRCTSLPPLGQLPLLKELFIECLDEVKAIGLELLGTDGVFPSLEILSFSEMKGWEKWSTSKGVVFPCLKQLFIKNCPNLVEVTFGALPSLIDVEITVCDSGVLRRLVEVAPALTELTIKGISGLNDVVWRGVIEYLGKIEYLYVMDCNGIRYLWESEAVASKFLVNLMNLTVSDCNDLMSLGEKEEVDNSRSSLLTSLRMLEVRYCYNMERLTCPYNLETLEVSWCKSVTSISLPIGGQKLKSLSICGCKKLSESEWGGKNTNNRTLEYVLMSDWLNLKSITELSCLIHLTTLKIFRCESLESFPDNELSSLTSLMVLQIYECPSMDPCFLGGVWPPNLQSLRIGKLKKPISEWGPQNFPTSLVNLHLYGGEDGVSSCSQLSRLLPSSLTHLTIAGFEKLESVSVGLQHLTSLQSLSFVDFTNLNKLSHLQHLTSLQHLTFGICPNLNKLSYSKHLASIQHLDISHCPKMMDLPEELFPSLLSLYISGCPDLKERCNKGGDYWPLISHILRIDIS